MYSGGSIVVDNLNAVKPGENLNPVKTLRMRYDAWRKLQPAGFK